MQRDEKSKNQKMKRIVSILMFLLGWVIGEILMKM